MRNLLILFCSLWFALSFSQVKKYEYYLYLSDYSLAPTFTNVNGNLVYSGTNNTEASFFSGKNLTVFEPAFPDGIDVLVKNIFYLETTNSTLVANMKTTFPSLYLNSDDITNVVVEMLDYYPNDYGSTSPNPNFGFDYARREWDYLHVPKAWEITRGDNNIKIGISDTPINSNDPDLMDKIIMSDNSPLSTTPNTHGTDVASTAAGRGDNSYGNAGVCMNCKIISAPMSIGTRTVTSNLYKMALKGAKVINMSWTNSGYTNNYNGFINAEQLVINDLVNNFRVTLVAASGNKPSFSTPASYISIISNNQPTGIPWSPFGEIFVYPATYDNVISVGSINSQHSMNLPLTPIGTPDAITSPYCCTSGLYPIYLFLEDSVSGLINGSDPMNPIGELYSGYNIDQWNPNGFFQNTLTLNHKVDILAPGWRVFSQNNNTTTPITNHGWTGGTSFSAPTVAGTIGLMLSVNNCLYPKEIEAILKLTTKDIENMPLNQNFVGYVGAGKLEIGDAVEFTDEMKKIDGNAVIDNHIFNRFDYELKKINNKLTISNATFRDNCKASFEARNQIHLSTGTCLKPNSTGRVSLTINPNLDINCSLVYFPKSSDSSIDDNELTTKIVLSPNPNNGSFKLTNINPKDFESQTILLQVFDINGRNLYKKALNESDINNCEVNLYNLNSGVYFVKLSSSNHVVDLKFIKN